MKIELWVIGKTAFSYLDDGIAIFEKRLRHYTAFDLVVLPDVKNPPLSIDALKMKEGDMILSKLTKDDFLVLLDEKGKEMDSVGFSQFIENQQVHTRRRLVFQIGGAYGFSEPVYQRANMQLSLSQLTFSHQMIRLFFVEQLYRAFTILKGEKYHNV
jgi:23S rRNA (pseudouridine1915-N3)-methyltransferase